MRLLAFALAMLLAISREHVSNEAVAAPPDLKLVPADARWLVLVDVDRIRTAAGWGQAHEKFWAQNAAALDPVLDVLGINLKDGLHSVTLYATQIAESKHPEDFRGAAIISVDFDLVMINAQLQLLAADDPTLYGPHRIYRWNVGGRKGAQQSLCTALHHTQAIVVANSIDEARRALDVLDGEEPNITQSESSLASAVPAGTLLLARGLDVDKVAGDLASPLLKQCRSLSLAVGQNNEQSFAEGQASLKSVETAEQIEALVNGYRALVQLQSEPIDAARCLSRLQCVRSDKLVTLSLRLPNDELPALLKSAAGLDVDVKATATVTVETKVTAEKAEAEKPAKKKRPVKKKPATTTDKIDE
jgi:hypothetical protein